MLVAGLIFAMAVGVILGSGPLRTAFLGDNARESEALRDQVAQRDQAVADAHAQSELLARYLDELTDVAAQGRLADINVALVVAPGVTRDQVDAMAATITQAGGTVVATATLADAWLDPDQAAFRAALAEQLVADVGVSADQTSPEAVLHAALLYVLAPSLADVPQSTAAPDSDLPPDTTLPQDRAGVLLTVLERAELLDVEKASPAAGPDDTQAIAADVHVAIVLTPGATQAGSSLAAYSADSVAVARLARAFTASLPTVLVQGERAQGDPAQALTDQVADSPGPSIVTHAWSPGGALLVVLAAQAEHNGKHGLYGDPAAEFLVPTH